jgi:hypothetical protein
MADATSTPSSALHSNIDIDTQADWDKILPRDVVIDPMVVRYGEVFLGGRSRSGERAEAKWRAIAADIGGLVLFLDQIILRDRLPIFDYQDTYEAGRLNLADRVLARVNQREEILVEVKVGYDPYHQAKAAAMEQLQEVFDDRRPLPEVLSREIIRHLSVFEYDWNPSVHELNLEDGDQQRLAAFLLGGLIFGAYAQQTGAPHVLQPKRARLFTAASLRSENASHIFDETLFGELAKVVQQAGGTTLDMPNLSFVPYLLAQGHDGETATDLLGRALALRSYSEMEAYRALTAELFAEWSQGRVSPKTRGAVRHVSERVARKLGVRADDLVSAKLNAVALATGGVPVEASVDLVKAGRRLWGWAFPGLMNRGSRKLLTRASAAQSEYVDIAKALRTRWNRT